MKTGLRTFAALGAFMATTAFAGEAKAAGAALPHPPSPRGSSP